jgi:GNAT superfamily N-acetyltransferase
VIGIAVPETPAGSSVAPAAARSRVTVRRVTPGDLAAVYSLRLEMLADTPLAYLDTVADHVAKPRTFWQQRIAEAARGSTRGQFVAFDTNKVAVGQALGIAHADFPGATVVVAVYVTPRHRGGVLLASLIDAVAGWSRSVGRPTLVLEVVEGNRRAERAYEKVGFTRTGRRVPHPVLAGLYEFAMSRPA